MPQHTQSRRLDSLAALTDLKTALTASLKGLADDQEKLEDELMGLLMEVGRGVVSSILSGLSEQESFEDGGVTWKPVVRSNKTLATSFGRVTVDRPLFRSERNGPTRCRLSERAGVVRDMWTPRAAKLAAIAATELTLVRSEELLAAFGGMSPSAASLHRLNVFLSDLWETNRTDYEQTIAEAATIPEEARAVSVSLDGVLVNMIVSDRAEKKARARARGKPPKGPSGFKEASVGVVTFYDDEGKRLSTRRIGRMPEKNKLATKAWLASELARIRSKRPDLTVVAIADGAPSNWTFLSTLEADHEVVDYYHTAQHVFCFVQRCNEASTVETLKKFDKMKRLLLEEKDGSRRVFDELLVMRKKAGRVSPSARKGIKNKQRPGYLGLHGKRMNYAELRTKNLPIGSGVTEGTCRHIVVDRLRRSGMRWSHAGGQAVLTLRALRVSGDFDVAWKLLRAANDAA